MRELKFRFIWLSIGTGLIACVVYFSLTPAPPNTVSLFNDKVLHFTMYFVLMGWFVLLYKRHRSLLICFLSFLLLGIVLELLQSSVQTRSTSVADVFANTAGLLCAMFIAFSPIANVLTNIETWFIDHILRT